MTMPTSENESGAGEVDEDDLKPCPFCGCAAEPRFSFSAEWVECTGCAVEVVADTFADAFEKWNLRTS